MPVGLDPAEHLQTPRQSPRVGLGESGPAVPAPSLSNRWHPEGQMHRVVRTAHRPGPLTIL